MSSNDICGTARDRHSTARFWLVIFDNLKELLIWVYPENLVKIGLLVEAVDTFCGMAWYGHVIGWNTL